MCDHAAPPRPALTLVRTRSFPGERAQIGQARKFIAAFLTSCPAADNVVLLASELASNAVTHSASGQPGGTFTVRAEATGAGHVLVEVEDQGGRWDGNIGCAEPPHGLFLLRELSTACGARRGGQGWITWFTIASPTDSRRPAQP